MARAAPRGRRSRTPAVPANGAAPPGYARTLTAWPADFLWPLPKIKRYTNNPRQNEQAVADVAASLAAYGARQPIVVDEHGVIVVGDTRFLAALQLQWPTYPVHVAVGLSEAEARGYRIADNKTGERAEWDLLRLKGEFLALQELGFDLGATGFRDYELEPILTAGELFSPGQIGGGGEAGMHLQIMFTGEQMAVIREAAARYPDLTLPEAITAICRAALVGA